MYTKIYAVSLLSVTHAYVIVIFLCVVLETCVLNHFTLTLLLDVLHRGYSEKLKLCLFAVFTRSWCCFICRDTPSDKIFNRAFTIAHRNACYP